MDAHRMPAPRRWSGRDGAPRARGRVDCGRRSGCLRGSTRTIASGSPVSAARALPACTIAARRRIWSPTSCPRPGSIWSFVCARLPDDREGIARLHLARTVAGHLARLGLGRLAHLPPSAGAALPPRCAGGSSTSGTKNSPASAAWGTASPAIGATVRTAPVGVRPYGGRRRLRLDLRRDPVRIEASVGHRLPRPRAATGHESGVGRPAIHSGWPSRDLR